MSSPSAAAGLQSKTKSSTLTRGTEVSFDDVGDGVDALNKKTDHPDGDAGVDDDNDDGEPQTIDRQLLISKLVLLLRSDAHKEADVEESVVKILDHVGVSDLDDFAVITNLDQFESAGHSITKLSFLNKLLFCTACVRFGGDVMTATSMMAIIKCCTDCENGSAVTTATTQSCDDRKDQETATKLAGQKLSKCFTRKQ